MSRTAEEHVKACTHPDVKGGTRALFKAIAEHIPEGQTTTPAMRLEDLSTTARHDERTARRARALLEALGLIRVHDGGRGRPLARYEIVGLTGERPLVTAPLPLLGRAKKPRRAKPQRSGSDLLSDLDVSPSDPTFAGSDILSDVEPKVGSFVRRWWWKVGHFVRRWGQKAKSQRSRSDILSDLRDGTDRGLKISSRSEEVVVEDARAREPADEFLTWWIATFSPHPKFRPDSEVVRLRDGPKIADLLTSRSVDVLQPLARLMWEIRSDGLIDSNPDWIATGNHSITVFHRKIQFLEDERDRLAAGLQQPSPADDVWTRIVDRLSTKMHRHELLEWFGPMRLRVIDRDADGEVIRVAAPELHIAWVTKHHLAAVHEAVAEVRPGARIDFVAFDAEQRRQA